MKNKDYFNIISLASIQVSNSLLPLFIFPFILKKVGPELYSKLVTTETIAIVVLSFIIFSFEINGVSKLIGLNIKVDNNKVSQIFSGVFYTRLLIFIGCTLVVLFTFLFLESQTVYIMLGWLLIPLSYILQSLWFFQGTENNTIVAFFTISSRLLSLVFISLLIKAPHDYFLVPLVIGGCYLLGGCLSLVYILLFLKIKLIQIKLSEIVLLIREGKEIFIGNMSVLLFRDLNVFLMSLLSANTVAISVYSITEKFIKGLQATTRPLNQFFFPRVIAQLKNINSPNKVALKIIIKQTTPQLLVLLMLVVVIFLGFNWVDNFTTFLKDYPLKYKIFNLFLIMVISVFFGVINFMTGSAGLNFLNEKKYFYRSILIVGVISILFCSLTIPLFQEYGVTLSFVLSEICLFCFIIRKYVITN